ncbi:ligand-dependent corepressor isoform X1 [Lissotriton helveticus]
MQQMIRQLAAEYTSKKTPTQDPILPNSTRNQSLPKASHVQSSLTAATTRNPVLSKLLMADQESPLDLTVKKSQLESKEQDGVLDLSTKKSPSVRCSSLSPSPSGSSTLGNGDKTSPSELIHQETQKAPTPEKLMVTLCPHHQKQYVHMLSDLDIEEQLSPKDINASACSMCDTHYSNMQDKDDVFSEERDNVASELHVNHSDSRNSICVCCEHLKETNTKSSTKGRCSDGEKCISTIKEESTDLSESSFETPTAVFTPRCFAASNTILNFDHISESDEGAAAATSESTSDVKNSVEEKEHSREKMPVNCYVEVKIPSLTIDHGTNSDESQKALLKTLSEETLDSDVICSAKKVDLGNSLQSKTMSSLKEDLVINERPVSPNQESLTAQGRHKVGNPLHQGTKCKLDNSKDNCPTLRKASSKHVNMKPAPDTIKTVRNCKRASGVRINDYDNQCDVVYISQPITECQFENKGSILSSRKTARKSTRGYLFNGEYCEISTVRTLFRSSKAVEILNCSKLIKERLVFPSQSLSTTLPLVQMAVVASPEKTEINVTSVDVSLPGSPCHKDKYEVSSIAVERKLQLEPGDSALLVAREAAASPLMAIVSHAEKTQEDISVEFQCKAVTLSSNVKYEEDTKLAKSFTRAPEEIQVCASPLNKNISEVHSIEAPVSFLMEKGFVDSNTGGSKEVLNFKLNSDAECTNQIVDNTAYPEISTPVYPFVAPFEKAPLGPGSEYATLESLEELHRNANNDPTFENINCTQSRNTESLDTEEIANVEGPVNITAAFSSKSSLEECHIDSRLTLSFKDAQEDLGNCRSPYSPEGSYGEDSVDFTLALSLEDTPRKDPVGSRDDFSTEDAHIEAAVETTESSEDVCGDISENRIICPIETSSDSNGASFSEENREESDSISFLNVSNEKEVLDSITTTLDLHSDDVANGDASSSILSVQEALDSKYTSSFPISNSNMIECSGVVPLSEDDSGAKLIPASPSEISVRENDICIKPASPSEIIRGEGVINVALVSPSHTVKSDECGSVSPSHIVESDKCGGNVSASLPAASIRKSKKPAKLHNNTSKRSAVNACSNNTAKKQQGSHREKTCAELIGNTNPKKVKKVGKSETVQDNHKKSEPLKKQNLDKNVLKKKSKKKKKSNVIKSDRCLRSQFLCSAALSTNEFSASSHLKVPCLKIKLVKSPGAKCFQRTVHLHKALSVSFPVDCLNKPLLEKMCDSNLEDSENSADQYPVITRQFKDIQAKRIAEDDTVFSKSESNLAYYPPEGLQILVDMNTNERKVKLSINCPVNQTQNTEMTKVHINTLDLDNIKKKPVIVGSKSRDSLASSQRFYNSSSGNTPKLSRTFMKQKNRILRNHNLKLASNREALNKMDLTAENSKVVNAKVETGSSSGKEDNICSKPSVALSDEPQETSTVKYANSLAEEENQELIADFNAKYMKVQKGWVLLDKEAMPVHRAKNKSDKLKEIWKTKKRVRKIRSPSEAQKLSPIQILFMKAFKLSDICKWFLETTETKSLVIVKKVTTRLPGDFPMAMIPVQRCASSVAYPPSAQAERLKKHLKKFPAASPLKNNSKTQKMWAKFRDPIEDSDSSTSTSSSPKTDLDVVKDHRNAKSTQNVKTTDSARILRKYSNMRGKLRSHNCMVNSEISSGKKVPNEDEKKPSQTDVCLTSLKSPKCTLQVENDGYCDGSEEDLKSKKKKKQSLDFIKSDTEPAKKKRKQDSSDANDSPISSGKIRPIVKKISCKVEQKDSQTNVPIARKQDTLECIGKGSNTASLKEKKAKVESKTVVQIDNPSLLKGNKIIGKTKMTSNALLATSPKAKGAKVSSCKSNKKRKNEPYVGKAHTRSMKTIVTNDVFEDKIKLKSQPRPLAHTKQRRLVTKR